MGYDGAKDWWYWRTNSELGSSHDARGQLRNAFTTLHNSNGFEECSEYVWSCFEEKVIKSRD